MHSRKHHTDAHLVGSFEEAFHRRRGCGVHVISGGDVQYHRLGAFIMDQVVGCIAQDADVGKEDRGIEANDPQARDRVDALQERS